jgi:hypothetical protein
MIHPAGPIKVNRKIIPALIQMLILKIMLPIPETTQGAMIALNQTAVTIALAVITDFKSNSYGME